ncbi:MAG: PstC family ABC transporter permease [Candidatus Brocadiia bacterium]
MGRNVDEPRKVQLLTSRSAARWQKLASFLGQGFLFLVTAASATAVLFILFFILKDALPFFREMGAVGLFESDSWRPTGEPPEFGALGIFVGSALVTLGSCVIAVPMGVVAAVCLSDVLPFGARQVAKPLIELLAAIPSVAYGFFALVIFAPILQEKGGALIAVALWALALPLGGILVVVLSDVSTDRLPDAARRVGRPLVGAALLGLGLWGLWAVSARVARIRISNGVNALNASIILAVMVLPTVVSVCEDALTAVGRDLREGSYALGATRAETMLRVVIPAARGGIVAAVLLGVMRAVGETMVVLMAAGNAFEIPEPFYNLLAPVRTLTATIALEMGETAVGSTHYHALFALGFFLLVFCFVLNLVSEWAIRRSRKRGGG